MQKLNISYSDDVFGKVFANFNFNFYSFQNINFHHKNDAEHINNLFEYTRNHKFIIYDVNQHKDINFVLNQLTSKNEQNENHNFAKNDFFNFIICFEGECLIIDYIYINQIKNLIEQLKKQKISLINISIESKLFGTILEKEEKEAQNEIKNFCSQFQFKDDFLKYLTRPLIGYLIRRFYYPSNYFKNSSFFRYGKQTNTVEDRIKSLIGELLKDKNDITASLDSISKELKLLKNNGNSKNKSFKYYQKNEFIILRTLNQNYHYFFNLVIDVNTFSLFLMKEIMNTNDKNRYFNYEIEFNKSFSHPFMTYFYGFLTKNSEIVGFIYEFQSNGSNLLNYLNNEMFSFILINRQFRVIEYLHSNALIYRDLKPQNILINHDNLPFISDFETIRFFSDEEIELTVDLGSSLYTSPEQDKIKYSFPTDIYSFGLIIYYLLEKRHLQLHYSTKKPNYNIKITKGSKNVQILFEGCIKYSPEERFKINEIRSIIEDEFMSFHYFENYLVNINDNKSENDESIIIDFIFEKLKIHMKNNALSPCFNQISNFIALYHENDFSVLLFNLGKMFLFGNGVDIDYIKVKKYYKKSANLNNSDAFNNLGKLYEKPIFETNYFKARDNYEKAAKLGNSDAYCNLGWLYYHGKGVKQNYEKAKEYFEKSAELKNSNAVCNIGKLYLYNQGIKATPENLEKAIKYFEKAAELNNVYALRNLGNIYFFGQGVEINYKKAKYYYEKFAQIGYPNASRYLGRFYEFGLGVERNIEKAIEFYKKSAELGDTNGYRWLGDFHAKGLYVKQDFIKARDYYEKAAGLGNATALRYLRNMYYYGIGIEKDLEKADEYCTKSFEFNYSDHLICLANKYANGDGVERDYNKAIFFYIESSKLNNTDDYYNLGVFNELGIKNKRNIDEAIKYYQKAANLKQSYANLCLGNIYLKGEVVVKNYDLAKYYYERSASLNNSYAFLNLGWIYYIGQYEEKNYRKAKFYFEKSALFNNSEALLNLGDLYYNGNGVEKDYNKAKEYYLKSVLFNNSEAMLKLGILFYNGHGVDQNYFKALEYFHESSKLDNPEAHFYLGNIYSEGDIFDIDIQESIKYYKKSIKMEKAYSSIFDLIDKPYSIKHIHNNYRFISHNNLGLIYLFEINDEKNAEYHINISANDEYSYGENNSGLFNQFYLNNLDKAQSRYERSSKQNFSLALFNYGRIFELKGQMEEAIKYYIEASKSEDNLLKYHDIIVYDKRLETSKTFIICLANLKLTAYFFLENKFNESKKYFIKSFAKLIKPNNKFYYPFEFILEYHNSKEENPFSYLMKFILNHPLFNLFNQPYINMTPFLLLSRSNEFQESKRRLKIQNFQQNKNSVYNIDKTKKINNSKNNNEMAKDKIDNISANSENYKIEKKLKCDEILFCDLESLFDFIIDESNTEIDIKSLLLLEINSMISVIEKILYKPPYSILFGRISILKPKKKQMELNQNFYDGFEN